MTNSVCPECPHCHNSPTIVIGETGFCANRHCRVISWDMGLPGDQKLFGIDFTGWPTIIHHEGN